MEKKKYTRYEMTRILAARSLQISQGAPVLIKLPKGVTDPLKIAQLEWEKGIIPIDVKKKEE
jgi:DNA-directed RNA polymerase subunit K